MYSNGLMASPEEIMSDGKNLVAFAGDLLSELNDFDAHVQSLLDIWHGASADSFSAVYNEEKTTLRNFQQMLNDKGVALQTASGILSDAEGSNASNASKLGS